jgi:hypothetical protein
MEHDPGKERRSSSIFRMPFRSKKDKAPSRSSSVSLASGAATPPQRGSLDERRRQDSWPRTRLTKTVPEKKNVYVLEKSRTSKSTNSGKAFPVVSAMDGYVRDKQTGEIIDHTDMLHSLVPTQSQEDAPYLQRMQTSEGTEPGQNFIDKFPARFWDGVKAEIDLPSAAALALTCKAFQGFFGTESWSLLADEEHHSERLDFLPLLDKELPNHLLCFDCGVYHLRTQRGQEMLRPLNVFNPLYKCPNLQNPNKINPRIRITFGRALPFTFVQLVMRAHNYAPQYGLTFDSLSRRYKDKEETASTWSHQTRFTVVNGHLLMRVTSQCFAPPALPPAGERHLLYSREDFVPYFSVCPHWRDGVLLPNVKCALHHIPKPLEGSGVNRVANEVKLHFNPTSPIVVLCQDCRPMRRCPECATEYLIEVKMAEDKSDPDPRKLFKQALTVTRWSDLGDGIDPRSGEWAAVTSGEGGCGYDSFTSLGKRAVSGLFESDVYGDVIPGQRMLSMNPEKKKLGEGGHEWY